MHRDVRRPGDAKRDGVPSVQPDSMLIGIAEELYAEHVAAYLEAGWRLREAWPWAEGYRCVSWYSRRFEDLLADEAEAKAVARAEAEWVARVSAAARQEEEARAAVMARAEERLRETTTPTIVPTPVLPTRSPSYSTSAYASRGRTDWGSTVQSGMRAGLFAGFIDGITDGGLFDF